MRVSRMGLALLLGFAASSCYTYTPVESPAVGSSIRVHVPITNALRDANQAPETAAVEGEVVSVGDTLALATERRQEYGAYREVIQYDTLRVGMDRPTLIEVRAFSSQKSILLGTVIAAGVTFAALGAFNAGNDGSSGQDTGPGPGPTPAVVASPSIISAILGLFGN